MANELLHIDNAETGLTQIREMTNEEQSAHDTYKQGVKEQEIEKAKEAKAQEKAKSTAEAKLAALGLTTDDLRALGL